VASFQRHEVWGEFLAPTRGCQKIGSENGASVPFEICGQLKIRKLNEFCVENLGLQCTSSVSSVFTAIPSYFLDFSLFKHCPAILAG